MKFSIKSVISSVPNCQARVGFINDIERLPGKIFETPLLLLYTKGGSVPHLTREVLQMVTQESQSVQLPLTSSIHFHEGIKEFKNGIAKFVGLQEYLTYCSIQDPAETTPSGYNDKNFISIWTHSGRKQLSANSYMDVVEAFKPDLYEALCDGDTSLKSSRKRCLKSVETSANMFSICLERHKKSDILKTCGLLGVLEGGYDLNARASCANKLADSPIIGVVIDGLHNNGEDAEYLTFQDVYPVVEESLKHLPKEMLRVMHGRWKPDVLLNLIQSGIDVFDSSLVFAVTERGAAFNFKYHVIPKNDSESVTNDITSSTLVSNSQSKDQIFEISLKDKKFFDDFSPIDENCSCLACKKHSRSYINHLLNTNELLGPVLLMICENKAQLKYKLQRHPQSISNDRVLSNLVGLSPHSLKNQRDNSPMFIVTDKAVQWLKDNNFSHNLHYYFEFFRCIRESTKQGNQVILCDNSN